MTSHKKPKFETAITDGALEPSECEYEESDEEIDDEEYLDDNEDEEYDDSEFDGNDEDDETSEVEESEEDENKNSLSDESPAEPTEISRKRKHSETFDKEEVFLEYERYIRSKIKIDENGCWIWQGKLNSQGYGRAYADIDGHKEAAHRLALRTQQRLSYDEATKLGTCRHGPCPKSCSNPQHMLGWGTALDQVKDNIDQGKFQMGETCRFSKLSVEQVKEIVKCTQQPQEKNWTFYNRIAQKFNMGAASIRDILKGNTWNHITGIHRKEKRHRSTELVFRNIIENDTFYNNAKSKIQNILVNDAYVHPDTDCWISKLLSITRDGYTRVCFGDSTINTHLFSYVVYKRQFLKEGNRVRHSEYCSKLPDKLGRKCFNPAHLTEGNISKYAG